MIMNDPQERQDFNDLLLKIDDIGSKIEVLEIKVEKERILGYFHILKVAATFTFPLLIPFLGFMWYLSVQINKIEAVGNTLTTMNSDVKSIDKTVDDIKVDMGSVRTEITDIRDDVNRLEKKTDNLNNKTN